MNPVIHPALIIVGPTASGKTSLSEILAERFGGEIINADVGQFYAPLRIGTAKPDWKSYPFRAHLFDIVDQPLDINILEYRNRVIEMVSEIRSRGKLPILVGGSFFYIKSLFFPVHEMPALSQNYVEKSEDIQQDSWEELYKIDPERALELHRNDLYRIQRALSIWKKTGKKPSTYKPEFSPALRPYFISIEPSSEVITSRIDLRTAVMLNEGWIDETKLLVGTSWEPFLLRKQLIGYPEIFNWINNGEKKSELASLTETIQIQTRQYAKRQKTFWHGFSKLLENQHKNFSYFSTGLHEQPTACHVSEIEIIKEKLLSL